MLNVFLKQYQHHREDALPGIAGFIQKLRHLSCLSTSCLSTDDDKGVFSHCLHDELLLRQHGQLQTSLLQQQIEIC